MRSASSVERYGWVILAVVLSLVAATPVFAVDPVTSVPYVLAQQPAEQPPAPVKIQYPTPLRDLLFGRWMVWSAPHSADAAAIGRYIRANPRRWAPYGYEAQRAELDRYRQRLQQYEAELIERERASR